MNAHAAPAATGPVALSDQRARRLRIGNLVVGLVHAAQVVLLLVLSTDFTLPLTQNYAQGPPGTVPPAPEVVYDLPLGPAVAAFLALAAVDHLVVAAPRAHRWYERQIRSGINPARWLEYSVSASLMIGLIAMLTGLVNIVALVPLLGANAAMILFGWLMERANKPDRTHTDWLPYVFGCVAGIVPWVAIAVSLGGAEVTSDGQVPTFVFGIFVSLFVLFSSFAVNQLLQYRRTGRWSDYVYGEWVYLVLSLTAKTALAWQVFANVLVG